MKNVKQISFIAWFDRIDDDTLTSLERGWREIVNAIDRDSRCNVIKKEKNINIPRGEIK